MDTAAVAAKFVPSNQYATTWRPVNGVYGCGLPPPTPPCSPPEPKTHAGVAPSSTEVTANIKKPLSSQPQRRVPFSLPPFVPEQIRWDESPLSRVASPVAAAGEAAEGAFADSRGCDTGSSATINTHRVRCGRGGGGGGGGGGMWYRLVQDCCRYLAVMGCRYLAVMGGGVVRGGADEGEDGCSDGNAPRGRLLRAKRHSKGQHEGSAGEALASWSTCSRLKGLPAHMRIVPPADLYGIASRGGKMRVLGGKSLLGLGPSAVSGPRGFQSRATLRRSARAALRRWFQESRVDQPSLS